MDDDIMTTAEVHEAHALPRSRAVHADPEADCAETKPLPEAVARTPLEEKSPAEWAYERLILYIKNFEEQLDNEHEVAMGFTGTDAGVIMIEGVGFFDPDIVTFYGTDPEGTKTQLIQHVSQLNVLLRALPKTQADDAPRRIGFRLAQDLEKE
ncbi:MAG: hypothetical protein GY717_10055 [Rhodobacteraceae bacterium]|nr:hypothetical protein [Paracoccaceae bacterium]